MGTRQHVLLAALCLTMCSGLAGCQRRLINQQLPGASFLPDFRQYSGYLSTGGSHGNRRLFYWLVESSQADPADAPLVLWLNGGPGCSSIGGMLTTNGPFLVNDRAQLDRNSRYAWNRLANMLYIDSPSGVGLSQPGPMTRSVLNDKVTAQLNLAALEDFFHLFPEYHGRPFFITGESYAGIYNPTLANAIVSSGYFPRVMNLKGIAVGNGLHVSWAKFLNFDTKIFKEAWGLEYNTSTFEKQIAPQQEELIQLVNPYNIAKPCDVQVSNDAYPCTNSTGVVTYLNDRRVRRALGVDETISGKYVICSNAISIGYSRTRRDVLRELDHLTQKGVQILLYHGNLDKVIPIGITQGLLRRLTEHTGCDRVWFYCLRQYGTCSKQVGGLQKSFRGGKIVYKTVLGAGHSVPTDRPDIGFRIFKDFLLQSEGKVCNSTLECCQEI